MRSTPENEVMRNLQRLRGAGAGLPLTMPSLRFSPQNRPERWLAGEGDAKGADNECMTTRPRHVGRARGRRSTAAGRLSDTHLRTLAVPVAMYSPQATEGSHLEPRSERGEQKVAGRLLERQRAETNRARERRRAEPGGDSQGDPARGALGYDLKRVDPSASRGSSGRAASP